MNQKRNRSIVLVVRDNCTECDSLKDKMISLKRNNINLNVTIYDINDYNTSVNILSHEKIYITPALFLDGRLKMYGDLEIELLKEIISA